MGKSAISSTDYEQEGEPKPKFSVPGAIVGWTLPMAAALVGVDIPTELLDEVCVGAALTGAAAWERLTASLTRFIYMTTLDSRLKLNIRAAGQLRSRLARDGKPVHDTQLGNMIREMRFVRDVLSRYSRGGMESVAGRVAEIEVSLEEMARFPETPLPGTTRTVTLNLRATSDVNDVEEALLASAEED